MILLYLVTQRRGRGAGADYALKFAQVFWVLRAYTAEDCLLQWRIIAREWGTWEPATMVPDSIAPIEENDPRIESHRLAWKEPMALIAKWEEASE